MPKSTAFANLLLRHLLLNETIPNIGDATGLRGASTVGSLYIALHHTDPGAAGTQSTNEISTAEYVGYARVAITRADTHWSVTNNSATNVLSVLFPPCTGGTGRTATFATLGVSLSGANLVLLRGQLAVERAIAEGVTPELDPGDIIWTET